MAKRRMLTKPVEKALRANMEQAISDDKLTLNENQTVDDVIEYIRAGIRSGQYEPGITFEEWYATLTPAPASSGDEAGATGSESVEDVNTQFNQAVKDAVDSGELHLGVDVDNLPQDAEPIDDLASWYELMVKAKAKVNEAQEMFDLAKKRVIERLTEAGKTKAAINGRVVATYTEVSRRQFNKTKFSAEYPDLAEQFTYLQTTHRFDLK